MNSFTVNNPIVTLSVTTDGKAVERIGLNENEGDSPQTDFERLVERELTEYFSGQRRDFSFPIRAPGTDFQKRVWRELQQIPYGRTASYGDIAKRIGKPGGSRAVGMANNRNPVPIVIPCHRVVAAGGKLGGFGGGIELKKKLLDLETRATIGEL
jgi:methylated-DNA-[protein]-cysteine S-methyltransferase